MSIQVGYYSLYLRVERSTNKVKPEPVTISSSGTTTPTTSSTKSNRVPHGPSLPSSKTQVTSTTQSKNESSEPTTTTSGRTIKLSSNGNNRHKSPQSSAIGDSPPSNKDTSTNIDR